MARIAIDEPSPELRDLFTRVVKRLGHEPVPAEEALAAQVLLLDPDGRSVPVEPPAGVPVILCSVYSPSPAFERFRATAHLVKPFSRGQLERAIARALGGRAARSA